MELESFGYDMRNLIFEWQVKDPVQLKSTLQLPQFKIKGYRKASLMIITIEKKNV